jgi:hypothetical protein
MAAASGVYESLEFTHDTRHGDRRYLEWQATAFDGMSLAGVTVLTVDGDDRIAHAAIHHRPLGAALRFSTELRQRLTGVLDPSHFFNAD